ncbi:hypothetical protein AAE02nite_38010 [Adhaeribacter aerolatus]|uniref:Apea-like HEPN domain-containing protein n=1 Tax=Adhaeribacter aerolatus TaxID=670289 RepID=A0A512B2Y2_9BACT|nr:hypothetical protein [Adhaeribacter aerolatus]GEO06137.1 hypothetical protein AAE02nite_38010 [Adhaeribacter aerolatus]
MRHYRELTLEINNEQEIRSILKQMETLKAEGWKVQKSLKKEYAKDNKINEDELVSFISPYYKNTKPKSEKEVFAGVVYLGFVDNSIKILDIKSVLKGEKLPVHLYNLIFHQFIKDVIKPNANLFRNLLGTIKLNKKKPEIQLSKADKKSGKKLLCIAVSTEGFNVFNKRLKRPIHFIERDGTGEGLFQEGDELKIGQKKIEYFSPNNIGILLSIATKSQLEARNLLHKIKRRQNLANPLDNIKESSEDICNYIEQIQTSIVFTYTTIEAFVNLSIPDYYECFEIKKESGVYYERKYTRDAIERLIPLKTKIKEILPDIYDTSAIENEKFFTNFALLEELRNKIIHQKSIEHTDLYKEYFRESIFKICNVSNELISFFYENCEKDFTTNPIWPWIDGKENILPKSTFNSKDFQVVGSIYD